MKLLLHVEIVNNTLTLHVTATQSDRHNNYMVFKYSYDILPIPISPTLQKMPTSLR